MTNQILLIRKEKAKMDKKAAKEQKKADAKAAKEAKKVAKAEKAAAKKEAKAAKKHEKEVKKMGHSGVRERKATVVPVYSIEHTGGAFEDRKNHVANGAGAGRPPPSLSCELQHWSRVESAADFVIRGWREFFQHMNFFHTGFDDFADEYVDRWTDRRAASAFAQILRDEQTLVDRGGGRVMDDDRLRWQRELDEE